MIVVWKEDYRNSNYIKNDILSINFPHNCKQLLKTFCNNIDFDDILKSGSLGFIVSSAQLPRPRRNINCGKDPEEIIEVFILFVSVSMSKL